MNYTVTYTSNNTDSAEISDWNNIKLNNYRSLDKAGYLTEDEFFDIFINAYKSTYGYEGKQHPGDLYVNISSALEVVCNTLQGLVDTNYGRSPRDVKSI